VKTAAKKIFDQEKWDSCNSYTHSYYTYSNNKYNYGVETNLISHRIMFETFHILSSSFEPDYKIDSTRSDFQVMEHYQSLSPLNGTCLRQEVASTRLDLMIPESICFNREPPLYKVVYEE
jgi:hypothetical protein